MRAAVLLLPLALLAACSALFEDPAQCTSDSDCAKYAAVCSDGVCATRAIGLEAGPAPDVTPPPVKPPPDGDVDTEPPPDTHCDVPDKPVVELSGDITADQSLACTSIYVLKTRVIVRSGATLTIEGGTTIKADAGTSLVIQRGAKILANGTRDRPVVMTSSSDTPAPGAWAGLYVLGTAPSGDSNYFLDSELVYNGGTDADSDSGTLSYVRIEYGVYGLALGAVGRKTKIDNVMVHLVSDNCFTLFGGTADLKHLICQYPGDEMLEMNDKYEGRIQYFFGAKPPTGDEHHGILTDISHPLISNITLCGENLGQSYGVIIRNGSKFELDDAIVTGWFGGVDTRNAVSSPVEIKHSVFFGNAGNPAYIEGQSADPNSPLYDDDNSFDENAWFRDASRGNAETDPGLPACGDPTAPKPAPATSIPGGSRSPDGFFDAAPYAGAFKDANDAWATGAWVRFGDK